MTENNSFNELMEQGKNLFNEGKYIEAIKLYKLAYIMKVNKISNSDLGNLYIRLGNAYYSYSDKDKAGYYYEKYLELFPQGQASVFSRIASKYYYTDAEKCVDCYNKALNMNTNRFDVENKLFAMTKSAFYTQLDVKEESEQEIANLKNALKNEIFKYDHSKKKNQPDKKLNIGYLSSDVYTHTMMNYILPIWQNHNKDEFNFIIFNGAEKHDRTTEQVEGLGFKIVPCPKMNDKDVAKLIYENDIDILIDLGGYTHLKSFSALYKPAPIIISYLGYLNTLGIKEVDYILADKFVIPEDKAYLYTEKPLYNKIGYTIFAEKPFPEVSDCPFVQNGYITYGCFNCTSKLSDMILYIWSKILEKDTTSKLLIYRTQLTRTRINIFKSKFKKLGINEDRLIFSNQKYSPHYKAYSQADIALDPYPFSGMSIALEAAMMGVPTVTLLGEGIQSRGVGRINKVLGFEELLNAENGEEYINKAVNLANNKEKLIELNKTLREKVENSSIIKGAGEFTKDLEDSFRKIWLEFTNNP